VPKKDSIFFYHRLREEVPGTIAHMMEGKKDLELSNIALSSSQVSLL
jgi:hypothetical protein